MPLPDPLAAGLARQLAGPSGLPGRAVGRLLNRANRRNVRAAVEALDVRPGQVAADVGFGGGAGLSLLLDRVGPQGRVHGLELSELMLRRAGRRFRSAVGSGRLHLHPASMSALPLPDGAVDALLTTNTVYFVEDLPAAFAELARVLDVAGRLVVGVGDPAAMASEPVTAHGFRLRPIEDLIAQLWQAGLEVADHARVGGAGDAFHLLLARKPEPPA